jgi:hypothetical protein
VHRAAVGPLEQVERDGFTLLPGVFSAAEVEAMRAGLGAALEGGGAGVLGEAGGVYAARNVLSLWPAAAEVWRRPALRGALAGVLGPRFGLVRALFFDKPPQQSWALPWHKDLTIAVRDNRRPSPRFRKPTRKAGVPHVEAPVEVLRAMLTARVHLDDVSEENGPLKVIPGSHRGGKVLELGEVPPHTALAARGDVLLMRPLLAHCSNRSHAGTLRRRRILHLEFAALPELPDGYAWHTYLPAEPSGP